MFHGRYAKVYQEAHQLPLVISIIALAMYCISGKIDASGPTGKIGVPLKNNQLLQGRTVKKSTNGCLAY